MNISFHAVRASYKELNIIANKRLKPKKSIINDRICKGCNILKQISEYRQYFSSKQNNASIAYTNYCLNCSKIRSRTYKKPYNKFKSNILQIMWRAVKENRDIKNGETIFNVLGYSSNKLKNHIENQFEDWMTWENRGNYRLNTWDDNNKSTWVWQLDHINPQSELPYFSIQDENFKKCWALENLRPYSAKQNILDGSRRTRHKKI